MAILAEAPIFKALACFLPVFPHGLPVARLLFIGRESRVSRRTGQVRTSRINYCAGLAMWGRSVLCLVCAFLRDESDHAQL